MFISRVLPYSFRICFFNICKLVASTVAAQVKCKWPQLQTGPSYQRAVFLSFFHSFNLGTLEKKLMKKKKRMKSRPLALHCCRTPQRREESDVFDWNAARRVVKGSFILNCNTVYIHTHTHTDGHRDGQRERERERKKQVHKPKTQVENQSTSLYE